MHLNEKLEKQTEELLREKSKTKDLSELVQQLKQKLRELQHQKQLVEDEQDKILKSMVPLA